MLYIRADGNSEIGTGHIMRCLSIAAAYRKSGGNCVFVTADERMKPLIDENGFSVICLYSIWNDLDREIEKMEQLIAERRIERLLVDSYFVTPDYLTRLHKLTYLIYMDDIDSFVYPCSELINYNINADKLDYPSRYPNTRLRLGPKYAPLREEFNDLPPHQIRRHAESALITTGGSDPFNIAEQLATQANRHPYLAHLHFNIVVGRFSKRVPELQAIVDEHPGVAIHRNVSSISELMRDSDIAVSAGGSTLYELCACGVPTVVYTMADNQREIASAFSDGYMLGCGDWRDGGKECLERIIANLFRLADCYELRKELAKKCWGLVNPRAPLPL